MSEMGRSGHSFHGSFGLRFSVPRLRKPFDCLAAGRRLSSCFLQIMLLILCGCAASRSSAPAAPTVAIVGGSIVDPSGSAPTRPVTIIISRDRIVSIQPGEHRPAGARLIEARERFVVPGLWDMHAHLATGTPLRRAPENYVGHGVVAIRDMGGHLDQLQRLRHDISSGSRVGPMMFIAGPTLNGEASAPFHRVVRNDAEARAAVRELSAAGVDFIKVHRRTGAEAFRAIADETRRLGIGFAGHVPLALRWPEAAGAGMRTIEHAQALVENEYVPGADPVEATLRTLEQVEGTRGAEIFAALARHGTYFTPTLIFFERSWERDTAERRAIKQRIYARLQPLVGRAAASGIRILAGSDLFGSHGAAVLGELERLVGAGLTPRQALAAATTNPRNLIGRGPGHIAVGEEASLLILEADPTTDIRYLRRLSTVLLRGRVIEATELQELQR
jgi:imidazolonepropionase-like amidohydrolase